MLDHNTDAVHTKDMELGVTIQEALHGDDRLSADSIDVTVVNGVATLTGTVQSYRRKLVAADTAESIGGCRGVRNKIVVAPPGNLSDDETAQNVRGALESHSDITKQVITVQVKGGVVTLQGRVASWWERALAADVAMGARGAREVNNLLLVDLDGKIEDEALTSSIQYAISRTSGLQSAAVRVAVNTNTAVLSGEVDELWQRRRAEQVVDRFRVTDIQNEIALTDRSAESKPDAGV